jgi:integrase
LTRKPNKNWEYFLRCSNSPRRFVATGGNQADAFFTAGVRLLPHAFLAALSAYGFRHSYRMWIDAVGTPVGVQQKLMRHSDIRTTMNIYGDAATKDMRDAHNKIVGLALKPV